MKKPSLFSLIISFISLMLFWVVMSGFLDFIHLSMGVISVAGVMYVNYKLRAHRFFNDDISDLDALRFHRAFLYFFWMIGQIIMAGFHVAALIIRPSMPVRTSMITFRADLPSAQARMILGNSITLTPGTLTIDIQGDVFTVHALDDSTYQGITSDHMPRQVLQLFQKEVRQVVHDVTITHTDSRK